MNRFLYSCSLLVGALLFSACTEQSFTALSTPPPIQVTGQSFLTVTPGQPFSMTLHATGGEGLHTWRITDGALPPGLALAADGGPDAVVAGTPEAPTNQASYAATIEVEDAYGNVGTFALGLFVSFPTMGGPLEITTSSVARGYVGQAYVQTLEAEGGAVGSYVWSIAAGQLPAGLSLTSGSTVALVLGVPTQTGTVSARLRVMDGDASVDERDFSFVVRGPSLVVVTSTLTEACTSSTSPYQAELEAHGGTGGYVWSIASGQLPPGLTLSATGWISGQVAASGFFSFVVRVEDSSGASATRALAIDASCEVRVVDSLLPAATTTSLYQHMLEARGGVPPYTWARIAGAPNGLEVRPSGELIGVPTRTGTIAFTVRASDTMGESATKTLYLLAYGPLEITTSSVATSTAWVPFDFTLSARGGRPPYVWTGWNLPLGYSVRSDGHIVGTSTVAGYHLASVLARDSLLQTATATITVHVR